MKLDYFTMISPDPIVMNFGTVRKPTLGEISQTGMQQFNFMESLLVMTPEVYFTKVNPASASVWDSLTEKEKNSMTIFRAFALDETLVQFYLALFDYFLEERVDYQSGYLVVFNQDAVISDDPKQEDIKFVIGEETFQSILDIFKQVCGMRVEEKVSDIPEAKLKNAKARALYERMRKAEQEQKKQEGSNPDYSIPNIISAVSSRHPSLNLTNIWGLTVYQLMDTFDRLRRDVIYDIGKTSIAVWGDEKNRFKVEGWYHNEFDNEDGSRDS